MTSEKNINIFLVDDDAVLLKAMEIEFAHAGGYNVKTFPTGEQCMENIFYRPDVVVLDYHLDGISQGAMNGIETLDKIKAYDSNIHVIMLSSQDKITVAIDCMHHNALDYVIKSETAFLRIEKVITAVMSFQKMRGELNWYMERM